MKLKILIIGKKSFIAYNFRKYLELKKICFDNINFQTFLKKNSLFYNKFDLILNCTSNKNFIKKKYTFKNDYDSRIASLIVNCKTKLILISTRKVYKPKKNFLNENDETLPKCQYSKNKLKAEKVSLKLLGNRLLILRLSNLVGIPVISKRKLHDTFMDVFVKNAMKGIIFENLNNYKDFISTNQLAEIIVKLAKSSANGVYNVSLGKKVYLNKLVRWLNFYNFTDIKKKEIINSFKKDNFTLSNKKLKKKIKFDNSLISFKKECLKLSKQIFDK